MVFKNVMHTPEMRKNLVSVYILLCVSLQNQIKKFLLRSTILLFLPFYIYVYLCIRNSSLYEKRAALREILNWRNLMICEFSLFKIKSCLAN
ncbi:hypothetical protein MtrunA17_Chr6g0469041 [Medicago truncatula]|uniref:Transmembrane protein n=1 Tax=Medicago truncatula TaxID=3880 RepID=A0A396HDS5_MEDTR|nr:hypothetical protein MtrunA17_Chr6g0469041 [Medicago truncatula]